MRGEDVTLTDTSLGVIPSLSRSFTLVVGAHEINFWHVRWAPFPKSAEATTNSDACVSVTLDENGGTTAATDDR